MPMITPAEVQKTFKMTGDLIEPLRKAKEDFDYSAEYLLFNDLIRLGLSELYRQNGVDEQVVPDVAPEQPLVSADDLVQFLTEASDGDATGFLSIADIHAILTHRKEVERLTRLYGDDLDMLDMYLNLFHFQFYSKVAYLNYLLTPSELNGFPYNRLIPLDLTDTLHPLYGLLEDLNGVVTLSAEQQRKVKELFLKQGG